MKIGGAIFYRGPSVLTGAPIVGVLTGLDGNSLNPKTGPSVQSWMLRADLTPMGAKRQNLDDAVCGDCALRGRDGYDSACYVTPWLGPLNVYKAFRAGQYLEPTMRELQALVEGRTIRLGAYGDAAALPFAVWAALLATTRGWIGYTHQWRTCDPAFKTICMASVESVLDASIAQLAGWRTFRVRAADEPVITGAECVCPASDEAGHRTTCDRCQLCRGTNRQARSVAIVAHGKPSNTLAFYRTYAGGA